MADSEKVSSSPAEPALGGGGFVDPTSYMAFLHEWNTELASHYLVRLQSYAMLPFKLSACRSSDDVAELQTDFCRRLISDYRSKAARLCEVAGSHDEPAVADGEREYSARILKAQEDAREIIRQAREQAKRITADAGKAVAAGRSEGGEGESKAA
jgi:hypothetical protein